MTVNEWFDDFKKRTGQNRQGCASVRIDDLQAFESAIRRKALAEAAASLGRVQSLTRCSDVQETIGVCIKVVHDLIAAIDAEAGV